MACLHLIRAQISAAEYPLVNFTPEQDACVLIDDGVYLASDETFLAYVAKLNVNVYASKAHLTARALKYTSQISVVDDVTITTLLLDYEQSLTWQ